LRLSWPRANDKKRALLLGLVDGRHRRIKDHFFVNTTWYDAEAYHHMAMKSIMPPAYRLETSPTPTLGSQPQPKVKRMDLIYFCTSRSSMPHFFCA
jgi:hypothetical protein